MASITDLIGRRTVRAMRRDTGPMAGNGAEVTPIIILTGAEITHPQMSIG